MLPALLGLMAPVVAVRALTQLARAAGAALRSATARVALPVPTNAEKAAEGFFDNSDSPVIFAYDGYGRRIKIAEFDNGNLTSKKLYWWLGGQIVCERDGIDPGFPLTKRYFGQGVVVGAERLYYTMDQLGSVRELVDANGVVRADYRYSTYGERTKVGGDLDSDFGYGGLFHHGPSGLDLATYRTYDSKMGRWLSRDPLGEGVDYNLYRYCGNNPISNFDPTGLKVKLKEGTADWADKKCPQKKKKFQERWDEAVDIAKARLKANGYRPFQGYPLLYTNDVPSGFGALGTSQWQQNIRYEDYLEGDWDVTFRESPDQTGAEQMHTSDAHTVDINDMAVDADAPALADLILHELTHVGLMRIHETTNYWDLPQYGGSGHVNPYFGTGIDSIPAP